MARSVAHSAGVVARLRAGRTLARLRTLMDWHLFQKAPHQAEHELLLPAPGLFAKVEPSQYVFIIGTYTRYGAPMADVIALRPQPGPPVHRGPRCKPRKPFISPLKTAVETARVRGENRAQQGAGHPRCKPRG